MGVCINIGNHDNPKKVRKLIKLSLWFCNLPLHSLSTLCNLPPTYKRTLIYNLKTLIVFANISLSCIRAGIPNFNALQFISHVRIPATITCSWTRLSRPVPSPYLDDIKSGVSHVNCDRHYISRRPGGGLHVAKLSRNWSPASNFPSKYLMSLILIILLE